MKPLLQVDRALVLRDLALKSVRECGAWERAGSTPLMMLRGGEIMSGYRTPFQRPPELSQKTRYYLALLGGPTPLPSGLDIWHREKKVLSIEWEEGGRIALLSFTQGAREAELAPLAGSPG
jgi:hypothetical protein